MTTWLRILLVSFCVVISACISTGTRAITDDDLVSRIEVGKSTHSEITSLLGYPVAVSYDANGEETWRYTYVTAAPLPTEFIPVVKAFTPSLLERTRELFVTFDRTGVVQRLGQAQPALSPG